MLARSALPPVLAEAHEDDPMGVTIHRLSNGMTVYISTNRQQPRFDAWIAVRAGSRHDPADSTGLAHYLEHMLFKGTDELGTTDIEKERPHLERIERLYDQLQRAEDAAARRDILAEIDAETQASAAHAIPNALDRLYTTIGIEGVNAFTSDEQTVYIADVPSNRLEAWAAVEAERFADPVFRLFYPELEAVYEEKNLSLDDAGNRVREALLEALYPRHPYGTQPTIGRIEHLKTPAYGDMVEYNRRWYVPNNMAIVLAGDIDAEQALPVLERRFGRLQPEPLPPVKNGSIVPVEGRVFREVVSEDRESVTVAWHTVPVHHDDQPALRVMDLVMDNATTGLLNIELELSQKVPSAGSSGSSRNESGHWSVWATARQGQPLKQVESLLLGVIDDLKRGRFTQADIDAMVLHHEIARSRQLESNRGRVSKMADAYIGRRSWADVLKRDQRLREVTRKDVIDVARKYLGEDFVVVYRRKGTKSPPKIEKPSITPVELHPGRSSEFAERIASIEAKELEPKWLVEGRDYQREQLGSGPMIAVSNQRNELFSLAYRFQHGYRDDPLLCHALDLLELSGAGQQGAEALRRELYALGTTINVSCNAEASTIRLDGVDENLEASVTLLKRWFREPAFDEGTVDRLLVTTLSRRRDHLESPRLLSRALSDYANYGKKSAWREHPSNRRLRRTSGDELRGIIQGFPNREHRTLYFGPRKPDSVADILAFGGEHREARAPRPRRYRDVADTRIWFLHKQVAKSSVELLFPRQALDRPLRPVAELYSSYLSGDMSALIFQEIREARGLAYSAGAYYTVGRTPTGDSGLLGRMATQSDKTVEALELFLTLIRARSIDEERWAAAKLALEQQYRSTWIDPRRVTHRVDAWDMLGESSDPRPWRFRKLSALSREDLARFARALDDAPVIVSIVGDRNRIDMDALEAIAPVEQMQPEQLFSYGPFEPEK